MQKVDRSGEGIARVFPARVPWLIVFLLAFGLESGVAQSSAEPSRSGQAEAQPSQETAPVAEATESAKADIRHLMDLMGVPGAVEELFSSFFAQIGRDFQQGLQGGVPSEDRRREIAASVVQKLQSRADPQAVVIDATMPFYEKNFSPAEIKGLIQFYESPLGRHFAEVHLRIMPETMARGQQWTQENFTPLFQAVMRELVEEYPELKQPPPPQQEAPPQPQTPDQPQLP